LLPLSHDLATRKVTPSLLHFRIDVWTGSKQTIHTYTHPTRVLTRKRNVFMPAATAVCSIDHLVSAADVNEKERHKPHTKDTRTNSYTITTHARLRLTRLMLVKKTHHNTPKNAQHSSSKINGRKATTLGTLLRVGKCGTEHAFAVARSWERDFGHWAFAHHPNFTTCGGNQAVLLLLRALFHHRLHRHLLLASCAWP